MLQPTHIFKALSDDTRIRLLHILNRFELNVNEIVSIMAMGQSRVSRHLKILTEAGLLETKRDGLWVFYSASSHGAGRKFINAIMPFMDDEPVFRADISMASGIIEERANKTRQFFNTVAEDWDKMARDVLGEFELVSEILEHMPKCNVAVDLGCGTGNIIEQLLQKSDQVIGVDGSARMLELARRRFTAEGQRVSLRIGDLEHLPLRDAEADFICLNMVLHHLSEPEFALSEIRRVMQKNGKLFITEFDKHENELMRAEYGDHWLGFTLETIQKLLTTAGFVLSSSTTQAVKKGLRIHLILAENPAA